MKRAMNVVIFVVALCICLVSADKATRREDGQKKYKYFFENEDEQAYDVLFFGTSHVLNGIFPMELWRDYGITSFNMGNNSEPMEMTQWVLRMSLQYHKPKIALFDVFYIDRAIDMAWTYPYRHLFLDEIPLSPLKVRAVTETLPSENWGEFLVPYTLYHGRWDELITGNVTVQVDTQPCMMGAEPRVGRSQINPFVRTTQAATGELPGTQSLYRIAEICRENDILPVFICIPSPATEEEQMNCNSVYAIAQELGVPFLNMLDVEGVVDLYTDCYDSFSHLNPDGALKVSHYLGQWLTENFELEDHRGDARYAQWDELLPEYEAYLDTRWGALTLLP